MRGLDPRIHTSERKTKEAGLSPLLWAARDEHVAVVRFLL